MKFTHFLASASLLALTTAAADTPQNTLEELVVTSSRIEMPLRQVATSVSVVTEQDIALKSYASLADLLRTEPSIGVSNSGGAGKATSLRIRGEEGYRTLLLIDGVDMADPTGTQIGPQMQYLANSRDIQRIEILRGPQGFMYGADAGGVVNVITATPPENQLSGGVTYEVGSYGTQNFSASLASSGDIGSLSLSATDQSTDGFNARTSDTELQDNDGADNRTLHLKGRLNLDEGLNATLVVRDIDSQYQYDACGYPTTHDCSGEDTHKVVKISLEQTLASGSNVLSYAYTDVSRDILADGASSYFTEGETKELEYTGNTHASENVTWIYGIDLEEDVLKGSESDDQRHQIGVYGEYQLALGDAVFITAGGRFDDNSDFGDHLSWRASAAYIQTLGNGNQLKYRATYGTGFRAPSLNELAYNAGPWAFGDAASIELNEENSRGYDLGVSYLHNTGASLELTYFNQRISNEIFFDSFSYSGYLQEDGESDSTGVELSLEYPVAEHWQVAANATYNDTSTSSTYTRSRRPEQLANLSVTYSALEARLTVSANLRIARDFYDEVYGAGLVAMDDYQVLDLYGNYRATPDLTLFMRVENLGDESYQEIIGYNTPELSTYAGVRYSF